MNELPLRSPAAKVAGIVYFGRMLDKIKAHVRGVLPPDYTENLGKKFDERCVVFLGVDYDKLVERVSQGGSDEEILDWCFAQGQRPSEEQIHVWNEYMRKRAWDDDLSEVLERRKREAGMSDRADIQTMFQFIDADEGRPLTSGSTA
jgi:gluconokinase